ncbi:MAG: hypothetical protein GY856_02980 [bacterium]|nr:hypothetical protein [bacterium]
MTNYLLALFGANGSGKSTVAELISRRYGVVVAPKRTLGPVRALGHGVLVESLRCYAEQAAVVKRDASTRFVTSRFGILDVMVYAHAFHEMNLISPSELDDLSERCACTFEGWPVPLCLVNLTARIDALLDRLTARDSTSVRSAGGDLRRLVTTVRRIYAAAVGEDDESTSPTLRRILAPYRQRGTLYVLDTTNESPAETAAQVAGLAGLCQHLIDPTVGSLRSDPFRGPPRRADRSGSPGKGCRPGR